MVRNVVLTLVALALGCGGRLLVEISGVVPTSRVPARKTGVRSTALEGANALQQSKGGKLVAETHDGDPLGNPRLARGGRSLDDSGPSARVPGVGPDEGEPPELADDAAAAYVRPLYESYDSIRLYQKMYGPLPVRPLGIVPDEFLEWRASRGNDGWLSEAHASANRRICVVNASTPNPLSKGNFQVLAYRAGDGLESIVGRSLGGISMSAPRLAGLLANECGAYLEQLPGGQAESLMNLAESYHLQYEAARRDLYRTIRGMIGEKLLDGDYERSVVAFYVGPGGRPVVVIAQGQDPELDLLTRMMSDQEKRVGQRVAEALRR